MSHLRNIIRSEGRENNNKFGEEKKSKQHPCRYEYMPGPAHGIQ